MNTRICTVEDCPTRQRCKGLCERHYSMHLRRGTTENWSTPNTACKVEGCEKPHSQRGLCKMHETRERRTGTTNDPKPRTRSVCSIEDCTRWVRGRGLCEMHFRRWKNNGDPRVVRHGGWAIRTLTEKFYDHFRPAAPNECWPWGGTVNTYGYGVIGYVRDGVRRQTIATRVSYEISRGAIPEGMIICHTCDNPICVNPMHLYAGTYQDNADDRWSELPKPRPNPELHALHG